MKKYIVEAINTRTGQKVLSKTNKPDQRIARLKQNIAAVNGQAGEWAQFERFAVFEGAGSQDIEFRKYRLVEEV